MAGSVLRVAVLGAGGRGNGFGDLIADMPELGKVVAVAEPRPAYRDNFAKKHNLSAGQVFSTWQELDRKSTRLNSSHSAKSRMPSSA